MQQQQEQLIHEDYRIALYYCYIPLSVANVQDIERMHEPWGEPESLLHGRIRLASEGLNGVLSGRHSDLLVYEERLRTTLLQITAASKCATRIQRHFFPRLDDDTDGSVPINALGGDAGGGANEVSDSDDEQLVSDWELDVKYCRLRPELSVAVQLFTELQIDRTSTVVGLVDMNRYCVGGDDDEDPTLPTSTLLLPGCSYPKMKTGYANQRRQNRKEQKKKDNKTENATTTLQELFYKSLNNNDTVIPQHLSPKDWDAKLRALAASSSSTNETNSGVAAPLHPSQQQQQQQPRVVLLDCRNVYESAVGYFSAPGDNIVTLLTNTRKYSELATVLLEQVVSSDTETGPRIAPPPSLIAGDDNPVASSTCDIVDSSRPSLLQGATHILMYCTGGVRCERASVFLQTLLVEERNKGIASTTEHEIDEAAPLPEIYQLHGGIQRYLEEASIDAGRQDSLTSMPTMTSFRGKNFVFDPRRTDPTVIAAPKNSQNGYDDSKSNNIVGQCLICRHPHDDYDNGNAPSLNLEARCYKCRILILVCDTCRPTALCWGEKVTPCRPRLYCGGMEPQVCLHRPPVQQIRHSGNCQ